MWNYELLKPGETVTVDSYSGLPTVVQLKKKDIYRTNWQSQTVA